MRIKTVIGYIYHQGPNIQDRNKKSIEEMDIESNKIIDAVGDAISVDTRLEHGDNNYTTAIVRTIVYNDYPELIDY